MPATSQSNQQRTNPTQSPERQHNTSQSETFGQIASEPESKLIKFIVLFIFTFFVYKMSSQFSKRQTISPLFLFIARSELVLISKNQMKANHEYAVKEKSIKPKKDF